MTVALYLAAVVGANLAIVAFGPSAAIPVAFLFVGLDLMFGDGPGTLALSAPMLEPIRALGYRVALVAQPGATALPWGEFDVLFIGGPDPWQRSDELRELVAIARRRGEWVHMGRVNSLRRMRYAESIGCDSADGTVLRFDPSRPVQAWADHVRANPSLRL
jgi:hypothetical protein